MTSEESPDSFGDENWEGWHTRPNRWLHMPPQLEARLIEASVGIDDFQRYIKEVIDVFPLAWADDLVNTELSTVGDIAQEPLWPGHDTFYTRHPACRLVSGMMLGRDGVLDLAKLGRDLYETKNLAGIQSVRRDLKFVDQYAGRAFELTVLAEFSRAGFHPELIGTPDYRIDVDGNRFFVEVIHRGQPFARHLGSRIWHSLLAFKSGFEFHGALAIKLRPSAGGAGENAHELGDQIAGHVVEALISRTAMYLFYKECLVYYDPRASEASLQITAGDPMRGDEPNSVVVGRIAYEALKSKIRQLTKPTGETGQSLIAANFGSLLRPIPSYLRAFPDSPHIKQHHQDREAIIAAARRFLTDYPIVSGVLVWWEQWTLDLDARTIVFGPHPVSLVVPGCEIKLSNAGLAALLGDHLCDARP